MNLHRTLQLPKWWGLRFWMPCTAATRSHCSFKIHANWTTVHCRALCAHKLSLNDIKWLCPNFGAKHLIFTFQPSTRQSAAKHFGCSEAEGHSAALFVIRILWQGDNVMMIVCVCVLWARYAHIYLIAAAGMGENGMLTETDVAHSYL